MASDFDGTDYGYKLHLIYGALAAPSEKAYATINDSPEAITFSWEVTTTPVSVTGHKPTASLTIDSTKVDPAKLAALELILYGNTGVEPRLPLPDEVASIFADAAPAAITVTSNPTNNATAVPVTSNVVLTFNNKISEEQVVLMNSTTGALITATKTWDTAGKVLTIDPTASLSAATKFYVVVSGVVDVYAQTLATSTITFTTA